MILDGMEGIWEGEWEGSREEEAEGDRKKDGKEKTKGTRKEGGRKREAETRQKLENRNGLGDKEWMNAYDTADYIGVSYGALRNMAYRREIPFFKMGRRLRFRTVDIRQHLIQNQVGIGEWKPCR